jgi:hypothetical protein
MTDPQEETAQNFLSVEDVDEPSFRWTMARHKFVHFYVQNGGDAKDAALKAGYAESSVCALGPELLTHAPIREAIKRLLAARLRVLRLSDDDIIVKWVSWIETDPGDYVDEEPIRALRDANGQELRDANNRPLMDPDGPTIKVAKRIDRLTKEQRQRIKSISISNNQFGQNVKLEFYDAQKAVDRLAEMRGIISKEGLGAGVTADDMAKAIRDALAKMDQADGLV